MVWQCLRIDERNQAASYGENWRENEDRSFSEATFRVHIKSEFWCRQRLRHFSGQTVSFEGQFSNLISINQIRPVITQNYEIENRVKTKLFITLDCWRRQDFDARIKDKKVAKNSIGKNVQLRMTFWWRKSNQLLRTNRFWGHRYNAKVQIFVVLPKIQNFDEKITPKLFPVNPPLGRWSFDWDFDGGILVIFYAIKKASASIKIKFDGCFGIFVVSASWCNGRRKLLFKQLLLNIFGAFDWNPAEEYQASSEFDYGDWYERKILIINIMVFQKFPIFNFLRQVIQRLVIHNNPPLHYWNFCLRFRWSNSSRQFGKISQEYRDQPILEPFPKNSYHEDFAASVKIDVIRHMPNL